MPLTKKQVEQLYKVDTAKIGPGRRYLHGLYPGLDGLAVNPLQEAVDQDYSTYFAIIIDNVEASDAPLKELLIQTSERAKAATLRMEESHDPQQIEKFIQENLDKDFKFD